MSILNTAGMKRRPTYPGEMLREDFLPDSELSIASLAAAVGVSRQSINELLRERRAVSPEMALPGWIFFFAADEGWANTRCPQSFFVLGL